MRFITIILFFLSFNALAQKQIVKYNYPITKIVDGDTINFEAKFLPNPLKKELSLRIYGIDTPEKGARAKCTKEKELSESAAKYTSNVISKATKTQIELIQWDKYGGRVLGDIYVDDKSLRQLLIKNGYAREYFGGVKRSWCD